MKRYYGIRYVAHMHNPNGFAWFASRADAEMFLDRIRQMEPGITFELFESEEAGQ